MRTDCCDEALSVLKTVNTEGAYEMLGGLTGSVCLGVGLCWGAGCVICPVGQTAQPENTK